MPEFLPVQSPFPRTCGVLRIRSRRRREAAVCVSAEQVKGKSVDGDSVGRSTRMELAFTTATPSRSGAPLSSLCKHAVWQVKRLFKIAAGSLGGLHVRGPLALAIVQLLVAAWLVPFQLNRSANRCPAAYISLLLAPSFRMRPEATSFTLQIYHEGYTTTLQLFKTWRSCIVLCYNLQEGMSVHVCFMPYPIEVREPTSSSSGEIPWLLTAVAN